MLLYWESKSYIHMALQQQKIVSIVHNLSIYFKQFYSTTLSRDACFLKIYLKPIALQDFIWKYFFKYKLCQCCA